MENRKEHFFGCDFAPFLKYPVHISETQLKKHPKNNLWVRFSGFAF